MFIKEHHDKLVCGHIYNSKTPPPNTGHYTEETTGRNGNLTLPTCRLQVLKYGPGVTYLRLKILQSTRGFSQGSS